MSPDLILLLLRLASAFLLLAFLGVIGWLIYRDMQVTAAAITEQTQHRGSLRVIADDADASSVGTLYPLLPVTSIGRAATNAIVLADSYASSEHALLMRRGGQWWLEDLGSRNGTLLNGMRLEEAAVVSVGDVITIGSTKLKIEA